MITEVVINGAIGASALANAAAEALTLRVWVGSRTISLTGCRYMKVLPERLVTVGAGVASVRISRRLPPVGSPG